MSLERTREVMMLLEVEANRARKILKDLTESYSPVEEVAYRSIQQEIVNVHRRLTAMEEARLGILLNAAGDTHRDFEKGQEPPLKEGA